jgi:citronellol/citronellal dehydrogenase
MKRYDLMNSINARGTYMTSKICLPHLKKSSNPHILNISPPLYMVNMKQNWFSGHVGYTMAKFGMTLCAYGMSAEFEKFNIGVNTLWPRTTIATAAVQNLLGGDETTKKSRAVEIMADSAYFILTSDSTKTTGRFFIDDEVLVNNGVTDLSKYKCNPKTKDEELLPDFFC